MSDLLKITGLNLWLHTEEGLRQILKNISLDIKPGEIHGLLGESGCGKTMLTKTILDLHDPERSVIRGSVAYKGRELLTIPKKERRAIGGKEIGYITQDPLTALNPLFPVGEQLSDLLRCHKNLDKKAAFAEARRQLEQVGIPQDAAKRYPHEFSGGQLQRICLAAAVCCEPSLVIADEPTTALDVTTQAQILELLRGLRRQGKAILLITHDFGVAAELCDRISVMEQGETVDRGTMQELLSSPKTDCAKRLIESALRKERAYE